MRSLGLAMISAGCLVGCAGAARPSDSSAPMGHVEPVSSCPGAVVAPAGFTPIVDEAIAGVATRGPGKGGLCQSKVFRVDHETTIYRVWDSSKPSSRLGRWWGFEAPAGTVAGYRRTFAICHAWNALNRSVSCSVKVGAIVAVGTGQSAACDDGTEYPASETNQIFVADPASALTNCTEGAPFP